MLDNFARRVKGAYSATKKEVMAAAVISSFLTGSLGMDSRGQMQMADRAVSIIVAIVVAGLLGAFLLPVAINEISDVETTDWDSGAAAMWDILPVMIVLAVFLFFVTVALSQRR